MLGDGAGKNFLAEANRLVVDTEVAAARHASLFPGSRDLISALRKKGIRVGLVTRNCGAAVLAVYPEAQAEVDAFLPREAVAHVKPHPDHLQKVLALLGSEAARSVMVGDHPIDITAALAVGMVPVGVTTGHTTRDQLADAGAVLVLDTVVELLGYV